jgi:hypothetical protein
LRDCPVQAAPFARGVFDRQQQTAAPFAAQGQTLDQAQQGEQDRRPDSDGIVGRQQAHQYGGSAHQGQRRHQGLLPADAVTDVAEDHAAEGAHDEGQRERRQRQGEAHRRVVRGEEQRPEHDGGHRPVQEVVVPLHHAADATGQDGS